LEASFSPVYSRLLGTGDLHPFAGHLQQRLTDCWIVRHASKSDTVTGILFHFFVRCAPSRFCFFQRILMFLPQTVLLSKRTNVVTMSAPPPGLFVASLLLLGLAVLMSIYF
jgi:hypothetical protein